MRQICAVLLMMVIALSVRAGDEVYRVGVENLAYYPLMNFSEEQNTSILKRIMNDFAATEGISFEFIPLPIQRFNAWYDEGAIDFRLPDNPYWTSQHDPSLQYSDPVLSLCANVVTLAENSDMPIEQFTRLGTLYGFMPDAKWQQAVSDGRVEVVTDSSLRVLTRMLLNGMVDGLDLHISAIQHQAEKLGEPASTFSVSSSFEASTLGYRLSTRQHTEVLASFNRYLNQQKNKIDRIIGDFAFREGCRD